MPAFSVGKRWPVNPVVVALDLLLFFYYCYVYDHFERNYFICEIKMRDLLADIPYFVEVARCGSFTRASEALDMPLPTLSRRISKLEKRLGITLFQRNTRKVVLTEAGASFFQDCEYIVYESQTALDHLFSSQKKTAGIIRLSLPSSVYQFFLKDALSSFALQYPDIDLHIYFNDISNNCSNNLVERYDIKIVSGEFSDDNILIKKLSSPKFGIYSSVNLLNKYKKPDKPEDLSIFPYIQYSISKHGIIELYNGSQKSIINITPKYVFNNLIIGLDFLLEGLGISMLDTTMAKKYVDEGRIVALLPEWTTNDIDIYLLRAKGNMPYRVKLLADSIVEYFNENHKGLS